MSMALTATKNWHGKTAVRRSLHGLAWIAALFSIGDGVYHLAGRNPSPTTLPPLSAPTQTTMVPIAPSNTLPGVWRWRFRVRYGAAPRLQLHTWQAKAGSRSDSRVQIPVSFPHVVSGQQSVDVTLSPGPSHEGADYLGDPAAQLYVCDTLKLQWTTPLMGTEPQILYVPNPFRASTEAGTATENLPVVVIKDGARTSVTNVGKRGRDGQSVDLALSARPGWGVTGAATLEFDDFGAK